MTTLKTQVPDSLYQQVTHLADREHISVDTLVALALNAQVSAWQTRDSIATRAKRGSAKKFDEVMKKIRDIKPAPNDRK